MPPRYRQARKAGIIRANIAKAAFEKAAGGFFGSETPK